MRKTPWFCIVLLFSTGAPLHAAGEKFEVTVIDATTREQIPCRIHLKNRAGRTRKIAGLPFWKDHFVCDGKVTFKLPPGQYSFEIERGPEYVLNSGYFIIQKFSDDARTIELKRIVDLKKEGWYPGDLHVHRRPEEIELLMKAEDLSVAPVITWWNDRNLWSGKQTPEDPLVKFDGRRFYDLLAGEDERGGGALLFFNLETPLEIAGAEREYPSALEYAREAKRRGGWVDAEKPFWWDVPTWLAHGVVDSVGLANNHMQRSKMYESEAWGRPRDVRQYPPPRGNGQWSQRIYYHILDAGLRIPPSAGSASGVLENPVGYNRVYVHVAGDFTYEKWWQGLRDGRVFVTNGPLLRPQVEGQLPGHVFKAYPGDKLSLQIALNLTTRDRISYLEVIKNGRLAQTVRLDQWAKQGGKLPPLVFEESGWFLVRAVTDVEKTYRFASTGPYYVQFDGQPRISRTSCQFFIDWIEERIANLKLDDPEKREEVLSTHEAALEFWRERLNRATAQ